MAKNPKNSHLKLANKDHLLKLPQLSHLHIHFIGVGGIGVSGLAEIFFNMGATISGSDLKENQQTLWLKDLGISVSIGHKAENVCQANVVIYSSAIAKNNVEFLEAKKLGLSVISRGEALAELMFLKRGVAVAGAHGKTTTTAMLTSVFMPFSPTTVVGGRVNSIGSNSCLGAGEWCLVESDESDGSFIKLRPEIAIITNLDKEHLDYYKSFSNLKKYFLEFGSNIPFYGALIVCGDDPELSEMFKDFYKNIIYYGWNKSNDFYLQKVHLKKVEIVEKKTGTVVGSFAPPLPGRHNALNALAAVIAGYQSGLSWQQSCENLSLFTGLSRRFELKNETNAVLFYDDYAHHPTEITAVIEAFKETYPNKKLKILFQPHRYSRTQHLWVDFLTCFKGADQVFLMDVYEAGEAPVKGVNAFELAKQIKQVKAEYLKESDILNYFSKNLLPEDIFLTLGAGDISLWNEKVYTALKGNSSVCSNQKTLKKTTV
ncbi:MAG: UDP-N-acetylmuramate--L-alanine ligase [Bdellovibrionaceae bacterium]|nr:UDP-N-acetylmuramate--L-alanine ligase [Pseudobdellovibrionaceae bacterium]